MKKEYCFYKGHALGNDYIVLDPATFHAPLTAHLIRHLCDRHTGLGSDGILFGPEKKEGTYSVRIFNPDGSEAEKSGNGIRIFAKYLYDMGYVKKPVFTLITKGGIVEVRKKNDDATLLEVSMGKLTFKSDEIPVAGKKREVIKEPLTVGDKTLEITCASIGNPHCVIIVPRATKEMAESLGPLIERHPMFPNRTNVQFVEVIDRHTIKIEIWERGAGYTLASGSSSSASAGVCYRLGLVENRVEVRMPGGTLSITIDKEYNITMEGEVTHVAQGTFFEDFIQSVKKRE